MSRISLGGGRSVSIRDYAAGLARTGHPAGALRYAQGRETSRKSGEQQLAKRNAERAQLAIEARAATANRASSRLDNVGTPE